MRSVMTAVRNRWCNIMHPAPMWPINGYYICPRCQNRYPVPWENDSYTPVVSDTPIETMPANTAGAKQAA